MEKIVSNNFKIVFDKKASGVQQMLTAALPVRVVYMKCGDYLFYTDILTLIYDAFVKNG